MNSKFKLNIHSLTLLVFCFSVFVTSESSRAERAGGYAQVLGGVSIVNNSGGTNGTFGAGAGFNVAARWSLGLDYTYNTFTAPAPLSANLALVLLNAKYYFSDSSGCFAGLKMGAGTVATSGSSLGVTATNFTWGPTIGTDFWTGTRFSVGAEGNLLWVSNSSPSTSIVQILANLKYLF